MEFAGWFAFSLLVVWFASRRWFKHRKEVPGDAVILPFPDRHDEPA